jgi:hypothetical protein
MGVETRPVPCNVLAWPRIRDLIMQNKFIYCYLYFCPDANACGCYLFSVERGAADLSMTSNSLDDALDEFARRGLISRDKETGEIWITDWPRWHSYSSPQARGALWSAIGKIQSRKLWITVKKAYESIPLPGKEKTKDKDKASSIEEVHQAAAKPRHIRTKSAAGIVCWNTDDTQDAASLEQKYGLETIKAAVEALKAEDIVALPSRVAAHLVDRDAGLEAQWWMTESGTDRAAYALGLKPLAGETYPSFRARIRIEIDRRYQHQKGSDE